MFPLSKVRYNFNFKQGRAFATYGILSFLTVGLGVIQSLAYAKVLGPETLGTYSITITVSSYAFFAQIGLLSGLNRELPMALGARREEDAQRYVGQVTTLLFSISVVMLLALIPLWKFDLFSKDFTLPLLLGLVIASSNFFFQLMVLRLRSELKTTLFASVLLIQKISTVVLASLAGYLAGFVGVIGVIVVTNLCLYWVMSAFFLRRTPLLKPCWADIRMILSIGMPIMLVGLVASLQLRMDRTFLIGVVTTHELGLYEFAVFPLTLASVVNGIVSQYIVPKLLRDYGQYENLDHVFKYSMITSLVVTFGMLALWPVVMPIVQIVTERWLPEYSKSLDIMSVLYIGSGFVAGNLLEVTLLAAKRQLLNLAVSIVSISLAIIGYVIVTRQGFPLRSYAFVTVGGLAVNYFARILAAWYCVAFPAGSRSLQGDLK